ncbi:hypothetical protein CDL12_24867 [Handroanthus impetiginosus]|uniref:Maintenance of Photosystem II under High light 2 C-terminal domain-containing protein n=1 Tax=Handroanthus impetiginosus TaxID=429701 RepID=A0A2G9GBG3_9LAMI|nr:hypothetical protein CDL12_24867 [Handroanthus impetiginosus]
MATLFLPCCPSTSSSSSCSSSLPSIVHIRTHNLRTPQIVCKAANEPSSSAIVISRRSICLNLTATATFLFTGLSKANAAILEAEDDEELLEKVKRDRKKRLEKQGVISSSAKETAYLQDLVYKLSKVGQALEKNDLSAANSVLGSSKETEWLQKVNSAFNKLSSSEEEKTVVDVFNSSLASLISSVSQNDIEASKIAFVASAAAFEKWTVLSGLVEQLKGL